MKMIKMFFSVLKTIVSKLKTSYYQENNEKSVFLILLQQQKKKKYTCNAIFRTSNQRR